MNSKPKIYIVGNTKNHKSHTTKKKFFDLEKTLTKKGFQVVNPLNIYKTNTRITSVEATLHNIRKLIECNAIYLMSEVSLKKGENLELKIGLDINLVIIQESVLNIDLKDK